MSIYVLLLQKIKQLASIIYMFIKAVGLQVIRQLNTSISLTVQCVNVNIFKLKAPHTYSMQVGENGLSTLGCLCSALCVTFLGATL